MSSGCPNKDLIVSQGFRKLGHYWVFFWNFHNCLSFGWKTGNILKVTWCIIGLNTTSSCSPPPFLFFFLQLKIGILIAQPQFLIHDAQKGHGLLISSDYEAHWTWSWLFLESFQQFFAWNYCLCARGGVIMQTLAVHFCQVKPSITNTYYGVLKGIYWNAIV